MMTRMCPKSLLGVVLAMCGCEPASKALLATPRADRPTPPATLEVPFKLAFAPLYACGIIMAQYSAVKPELLFITDVGETMPATGPLAFVSRASDVAIVTSDGTIVARAAGRTWIVVSLGPSHILSDSMLVTVRIPL